MISRRSFFGAMAVAPMAGAAVIKSSGKRISCVSGDPGELLYCQARADGKTVMVYLDGEPQRLALTADESLGMVLRGVALEDGGVAFNPNTEKFLQETVYGDVRIEIV